MHTELCADLHCLMLLGLVGARDFFWKNLEKLSI